MYQMLFYVLSPLLFGVLLLYICRGFTFSTILEKIAVSYIIGISSYTLVVILLALVIKGKLIYEATYILLIVALIIFFLLKKPLGYLISDIKTGYISLKLNVKKMSWKGKVVGIGLIIYCIIKVIMSFLITTGRYTYDEDAIASWDLKSKVFTVQKSLVLDGASNEFLGTAPTRIPYGAVIDTLLIGENSQYFDLYSNIISPLVYLILLLFMVGFIYRKTNNSVLGLLAGTLCIGLPYIFYESIGSYWNLPFGVGIVIFGVYITEYFSSIKNKIIRSDLAFLALLGFFVSIVRNEGTYYMLILLAVAAISYYKTVRNLSIKNIIGSITIPASLGVIGLIIYQLLLKLEQQTTIVAHLDQISSGNIFSRLITNISSQPVFSQLFSQMFHHPDYSLLYITFFILLAIGGYSFYKDRYYKTLLIQFLALFLVTIFVLFSNLELGLISYFIFIRYAVSFTFFIPLFIVGIIHYLSEKYIK